jgi:hypothetical protein
MHKILRPETGLESIEIFGRELRDDRPGHWLNEQVPVVLARDRLTGETTLGDVGRRCQRFCECRGPFVGLVDECQDLAELLDRRRRAVTTGRPFAR